MRAVRRRGEALEPLTEIEQQRQDNIARNKCAHRLMRAPPGGACGSEQSCCALCCA